MKIKKKKHIMFHLKRSIKLLWRMIWSHDFSITKYKPLDSVRLRTDSKKKKKYVQKILHLSVTITLRGGGIGGGAVVVVIIIMECTNKFFPLKTQMRKKEERDKPKMKSKKNQLE